jgi:hypothetical protein
MDDVHCTPCIPSVYCTIPLCQLVKRVECGPLAPHSPSLYGVHDSIVHSTITMHAANWRWSMFVKRKLFSWLDRYDVNAKNCFLYRYPMAHVLLALSEYLLVCRMDFECYRGLIIASVFAIICFWVSLNNGRMEGQSVNPGRA